MSNQDLCPCCSKDSYTKCCMPYLEEDKLTPGPEETMRSRYTAFCIGNIEYLKKTWHPESLPDDLDDDEPKGWVHLEILEVAIDEEEGTEGEVEFIAKLIHNKRLETLHEISQFEKVEGRWLYHSGEFRNPDDNAVKLKGSDSCPCQSGKLFKNCHGK